MMKKVWLALLAVVLVFGLAVLGCGGDSGTSGGGDDGNNNFTSDLTGLSTRLVKNQYAEDAADSRGLQAKFDNSALMQGKKVLKDDEITLQIKFKLDKTLDYDLEIGFVDTTVGESEGYWRTLTWDKNDSDDGMYRIDKERLVADTEIEEEITLTALQSASGTSAAANTLVFESRDLWSKEPVTITFVSFLVIFGDGGNEPPTPPPPPPAAIKIDVKVAGEDQEVEIGTISGTVTKLEDENGYQFTRGANWQASFAYFAIDFGTDKLHDFDKVKLDYQGVSGDIGSKQLTLVAKGTEFLGTLGTDGNVIEATIVSGTKSITGTNLYHLEFDLDRIKAFATYGSNQTVYFSVFFNASATASGADTVFNVSNIEFVKSATPFAPTTIGTTITLRAPVAGEAPATTVTGTGYTGTVTWKDGGGTAVTGNFAEGTAYTATIVLTKEPGYTFDGIAANSFVVAGATTVTNEVGTTSAETLTVTAAFAAAGASIPDKSVTFADADEFSVKGAGTTVELVGTTGYKITQTAGYDDAFAWFKVDFGTQKLSDYSKIDFTIDTTGNTAASSVQYKDAYVFAFEVDDSPSYVPNAVTSSPNLIYTTGSAQEIKGMNTYVLSDRTLTIDSSIEDLTEVFIIITIRPDLASSAEKFYTVKDIKFHN